MIFSFKSGTHCISSRGGILHLCLLQVHTTRSFKTASMMNVSCQCGAVAFTTPTPAPIKLYHCHCIDCRKQSASAFGTSASFPFFKLPLDEPALSFFILICDSGRRKKAYFCKHCGCRIAHASIQDDGSDPKLLSIKGGLIEGLDWQGGTHVFVRSAVVPIPEGAVQWEAGPGGEDTKAQRQTT